MEWELLSLKAAKTVWNVRDSLYRHVRWGCPFCMGGQIFGFCLHFLTMLFPLFTMGKFLEWENNR